MVKAANVFAVNLYTKLAAIQARKNLFLSPLSIQVALAMTAVGAKGQTRQDLIDLIGAPDNVEEQNQQYAQLLQSVSGEGKRPFELIIATALWGQKGYHVKPAFQEAIADFYNGALHLVDFRNEPDEAVNKINAWVTSKTRAKIKQLVNRSHVDEDARLFLTNAIYFKGRWEDEFDESDTRDEDWHGPRKYKVPMMHQKSGFLYYEGDDFQAVNLPYKGRHFSMLVVLPRSKDGLAALENRWANPQTFRQVTDGFDAETVIVSLPRFTIEAECTLKPVLCALHADLAFSDNADFSGIGDEPLKLTEVMHKACVEVNEKGTEAAAATAVRMMLCTGACSLPPEPKVFKADHPFLFFIWDRKANRVFFSGRVLEPK